VAGLKGWLNGDVFWVDPNTLLVPKLEVVGFPNVFVKPDVPAGFVPNKPPEFVEVFWPKENPVLVVAMLNAGLFWLNSPIL
jgi:hypothetical protein